MTPRKTAVPTIEHRCLICANEGAAQLNDHAKSLAARYHRTMDGLEHWQCL